MALCEHFMHIAKHFLNLMTDQKSNSQVFTCTQFDDEASDVCETPVALVCTRRR